MQREKLVKYAQSILVSGVNLKKGQPVLILADVQAIELINIIAEEAFKLGASEVDVAYSNEIIQKARFEYAPLETLGIYPKGKMEIIRQILNNDGCIVNIMATDPDSLKNVNEAKLSLFSKVGSEAASVYRNLTNASLRAWCIAAYPGKAWAQKVFANLSAEEAVEKFWDVILYCSHADKENPAKDWFEHCKAIKERSVMLNEQVLVKLYFTSEQTGTDIEVGLCDDTIWGGGYNKLPDGREYTFNMPTEEILAAPHRENVNGVVYSSKPLSYCGTLIEDFWFKFKDGKVVDFGAQKGYEAIKGILEIDEGATHLGEVALVPFSNPINQTGLIFYNTLYDENAVCHFALGSAYPTSIGGEDRSNKALLEKGMNISNTHVDFMFGTSDMKCIGTRADGTECLIMEHGEIINDRSVCLNDIE